MGGLSAALEIKSVDSMENGCVLVAGEENFGHMTSRVSEASLVLVNATDSSMYVYVDTVITYRVWINRVRLPILLVVS